VRVDELCDELTDTMLAMPERQGNFFTLFSMPLAARLMCIMLGVPQDDHLPSDRSVSSSASSA
jgi:cytochrome P450